MIGPLGDATRVLRGNYSSAQSARPIPLIEGLRSAMPQARITLVPFGASITDGDPVPESALVAPDGKPGLAASYYNALNPEASLGQRKFDEKPVLVRQVAGFGGGPALPGVNEVHKVVWTGSLVAPETGTWRIGITGMKGSIEDHGQPLVASDHYSQWAEPAKLVTVDLRKGERYALHFETEGKLASTPQIIWKRIARDPDAALARGIADADVIVAAVGLTSDLEGEEMPVKVDGFAGGDRTALDLPADQRALLEKAHASGKPLVLVAMNGSAIGLGWARDNAAAIVDGWYPGQAGGLALGQVLAGAANPAGRLPLTFYRDVADLPPFDDYHMAGRTYRYFTGQPVYGFGYGLSYTRFAYADAAVAPRGGDAANGITASVTVRNAGARAGDEVVQAYLVVPQQPGAPRLALRAFGRITLNPGESRRVTFDLSPRDLSAVRPDGQRQVFAGHYRIVLGGGQPDSGLPAAAAEFDVAHTVDLPM